MPCLGSKTVQSYSDNLSTLYRIVRRMILESLSLEKYIEEHLSTTYYLLQVMKYKEPQTPVKKLGVHEHTDRNMMTILHQNQIDGLEIQRKDGEWISLRPSQESFIVVIGDSLYAWTNGRVHSANHRVMLSGSQVRYSVGLFSVPKAGYILKTPDELVDAEHPLLFKPFDYAEFLKFYWTEYVKGADSSLKAYCGAL
ncbi:hypothetical protein CRG98_033309 [Punica granatum]|uniref:Fe2OG dioxygenase domain-containing protein n=1 Tax=Punica granatum TaxID=22663 RepID=A0A2I0IRJ8_PUNGR|nr:hypothetical protein CRG98_033309 [Punica granatum]